MVLNVSPVTWQQFTHKVFENIPNRERYKIVMDDAMVFSRTDQQFEGWQIFSKHWPNLDWKSHPINENFSKIIWHTWSYIHVKRWQTITHTNEWKCNAIFNLKQLKSVKECISFCRMVNFLWLFLKDLRKHLLLIYEIQKKKSRKVNLNGWKNVIHSVRLSKSYCWLHQYYVCCSLQITLG